MEWNSYLTNGPPKPIYHMCDSAEFKSMTAFNGLYYPPTYNVDGFIHATENPALLLEVGTFFYKDVPGDWICIQLNPLLLGVPVVYESAAPVGDKPSFDYENSPKFPHIYGGITGNAVMRIFKIIRDSNGSFLSIQGLC
jgi:uncharacterized protein (DUF952 family)